MIEKKKKGIKHLKQEKELVYRRNSINLKKQCTRNHAFDPDNFESYEDVIEHANHKKRDL